MGRMIPNKKFLRGNNSLPSKKFSQGKAPSLKKVLKAVDTIISYWKHTRDLVDEGLAENVISSESLTMLSDLYIALIRFNKSEIMEIHKEIEKKIIL